MNWKQLWAVTLLAALPLLGTGPVQADGKCKVALGGPAPELAGPDINGQQVDLGDMRGKWVYLDFWASWCKPCMRELPNVVDLHEELADRSDFAVMSISLDDQSTLGDLRDVRQKHQVTYPVVCDADGWSSSMVKDWCVVAIPTTFLIDPNGRVVERDLTPHEVKRYLASKTPQPVKLQPSHLTPPTTPGKVADFNAKHRLLRDSPTSGQRSKRDLQISLPAPADRQTTRYMLVVRTDGGAGETTRIRYDLEFSRDPQRRDFPFAVTIREASGDRSSRLPSGEKSVLSGSAVDFLPGAQVSFDTREQRLMFTLPLPTALAGASYTVSAFNQTSQAFEGTLAAEIKL